MVADRCFLPVHLYILKKKKFGKGIIRNAEVYVKLVWITPLEVVSCFHVFIHLFPFIHLFVFIGQLILITISFSHFPQIAKTALNG